MEDKPMRELHTLFTKIKNISMNSTKDQTTIYNQIGNKCYRQNMNISSNIITKENREEKC